MKFTRRFFLQSLAVALLAALSVARVGAAGPNAGKYLAYVGTYTGAMSKGIYVFQLDTETGATTAPRLVAETPNPTFLAIHPNGKYLYAANEIGNFKGEKAGAVSAYAIDAATGQLKPLNQTSTFGDGPCHLVVDRSGRCVLAVNYGGGSVAAMPLAPDGSLLEHTTFIQHTGSSVDPNRQKEPHAHSINVSPDNKFAFVADLGLDKIMIYRLDPAKATLTPNDPPFTAVAPGSGPRHFAFHPDGQHAYVINEMFCTVTAFDYDRKHGSLKEFQTISTLPPGEPLKREYSTAEVVVHPNGKFLYGSNRGHNTIAVFGITPGSRALTRMENVSTQGKTPRNFAIDPTGKFLFAENQDSHTILMYRVNPETGHLTPTGDKLEVGAPVCIKFVAMKN